ncbi:MAG TPA: sigma-70 family RNA polymerase sigma factor [Rugosimonospora sp.]|nr:sigma-70 family RNA polymerase sigma factor [Rugosimonospora sp.]
MAGQQAPARADDFDEFYRATARRTLRYAYGLTGDLGHAQDLTQEGYVRAWQRWSTVTGYDDAEAWVRMVVTRLATDRWRRLAVRRRFAEQARPVPPVPSPGEDTVLVTAALRRLPLAQRRVLAMHYLLDLPVSRIAAEVGVAEGTVKSWLARGRTTLAALLADAAGPARHPVRAPRREERNHA